MSKKTPIHLTIDADLYDLIMNYKAVHSDFSISQELEEWIRIKINANNNLEEGDIMDYDTEKAKLLMELKKLESKKELMEKQSEKDKLKEATIDHMIDNELQYETNIEDIPEKRAQGLVFLWKQRYNENISTDEARDLIVERIKQRGL